MVLRNLPAPPSIERLVDYIPCEYLAPVMPDYGLDVLFENPGQLIRSSPSFGQPSWILLVPHQCVATNFHAM
jgi:hypothetical protein